MNGIVAWFKSRKRSEQILVLGVAAALLVSIVENGIVASLQKYRKQIDEKLTTQEATTAVLTKELAELRANPPAQAAARVKSEIESLSQRLADEQQKLTAVNQGLVNAGQMTEVLSRMLDLYKGVTLKSVQNFPAERMQQPVVTQELEKAGESKEEKPAAQVEVPAFELYRHRVRMTLSGRYLDILRYLDMVEKLPWHVFWDEFSLDADAYPNSEVTMEFYTISTEQAWFKVS